MQLVGSGACRSGARARARLGVETRDAEKPRTRQLESSAQAARLTAQRLEQRVGHAASATLCLSRQTLGALILEHLTLELQRAHCVKNTSFMFVKSNVMLSSAQH